MYDAKEIGRITVEYLIDETSPGARTYCAICNKPILPEDERVVIRRLQHNNKSNRAAIFLCFKDALELANTIVRILGYGK